MDFDQLSENVRGFFGDAVFSYYQAKFDQLDSLAEARPTWGKAGEVLKKARDKQRKRRIDRSQAIRDKDKESMSVELRKAQGIPQKLRKGEFRPLGRQAAQDTGVPKKPGYEKIQLGHKAKGMSPVDQKKERVYKNDTNLNQKIKGYTPSQWHGFISGVAGGQKRIIASLPTILEKAVAKAAPGNVEHFSNWLTDPDSKKDYYTKIEHRPRGGVLERFSDGLKEAAETYLKISGGAPNVSEIKKFIGYTERSIRFFGGEYNKQIAVPKSIGTGGTEDGEKAGDVSDYRAAGPRGLSKEEHDAIDAIGEKAWEAFQDMANRGVFSTNDLANELTRLIGERIVFHKKGDKPKVRYKQLVKKKDGSEADERILRPAAKEAMKDILNRDATDRFRQSLMTRLERLTGDGVKAAADILSDTEKGKVYSFVKNEGKSAEDRVIGRMRDWFSDPENVPEKALIAMKRFVKHPLSGMEKKRERELGKEKSDDFTKRISKGAGVRRRREKAKDDALKADAVRAGNKMKEDLDELEESYSFKLLSAALFNIDEAYITESSGADMFFALLAEMTEQE